MSPLHHQATLGYLFGVFLEENRFSAVHHFIPDRIRSVRTDFTTKYEKGPFVIECDDPCVRYDTLAIRFLGSGEKEFLAQEDRLLTKNESRWISPPSKIRSFSTALQRLRKFQRGEVCIALRTRTAGLSPVYLHPKSAGSIRYHFSSSSVALSSN